MLSEFELTSEVSNEYLVIKTKGYINNTGGEKISNEFDMHSADVLKVVLDLEETKVVNSIGISFLIEIIEKLNDKGGKLIFTNLDSSIEKTFTIMGLFQFAEKADSVDVALTL